MPKSHPAYPRNIASRSWNWSELGGVRKSWQTNLSPRRRRIRNWIKQAERDNGQRPGRSEPRREGGIGPAAKREQATQVGTGNLVKSRGLVRTGDRRDPTEVFEFVSAHQAVYPVRSMCRVLEVSTSGYLRLA